MKDATEEIFEYYISEIDRQILVWLAKDKKPKTVYQLRDEFHKPKTTLWDAVNRLKRYMLVVQTKIWTNKQGKPFTAWRVPNYVRVFLEKRSESNGVN